MYDLSRLNHNKRKAMAARLLSVPGQRVWCHVTDGDTVLVNRQVRWLETLCEWWKVCKRGDVCFLVLLLLLFCDVNYSFCILLNPLQPCGHKPHLCF